MHLWSDGAYAPLSIDAGTSSMDPFQHTQRRAGLFLSGGFDSLAALRLNRLAYPHSHPGCHQRLLSRARLRYRRRGCEGYEVPRVPSRQGSPENGGRGCGCQSHTGLHQHTPPLRPKGPVAGQVFRCRAGGGGPHLCPAHAISFTSDRPTTFPIYTPVVRTPFWTLNFRATT
jgi:hypothetical protein